MKNSILAAVLAITSTAAMAGVGSGHFIEKDLNADGAVSIDDLTERRTAFRLTRTKMT